MRLTFASLHDFGIRPINAIAIKFYFLINLLKYVLVMVAINTRLTCKLMRCPSFQHNKKISEFHSNSKQSLVLNSFINENVERIRIE